MTEIWKDIKGYEELYQVSDLGRVKRLERYTEDLRYLPLKIMKATVMENGDFVIRLVKDGKGKVYTLGRLVYKTFNPNFNEKDRSLLIFHKDGNKQNNELNNLYIEKRVFSSSRKNKEKHLINIINEIPKEYTEKIILDDGTEFNIQWKNIYEFEGFYQVNNLGGVKSLDRYITNIYGGTYFRESKTKSTRIRKDGCIVVKLCKDGISKEYYLSRIVYKAFNYDFDLNDENIIIWHKDENPKNNCINNLVAIKRKDTLCSPPEENRWQQASIICITTNKEFESISKAEDYYGITKNNGTISRCCSGKSKSAGSIILDDGTVYKLVWRYLEKG